MRFAYALLVLPWLLLGSPAQALPPQASDRAPRAYGATLGAAYALRSRLPVHPTHTRVQALGAQLGLRFGWQIGGLAGGAPSVVGVEMDVLIQPAGVPEARRDSYGLLYGFFMKHSFGSRLRVRPFVAYGLGAAQVWVREVDGRGIGHATRLGVGVDTRLRAPLHLSLALSYQGVIMPRFVLGGDSVDHTSFHGGLLTVGLWYGN